MPYQCYKNNDVLDKVLSVLYLTEADYRRESSQLESLIESLEKHEIKEVTKQNHTLLFDVLFASLKSGEKDVDKAVISTRLATIVGWLTRRVVSLSLSNNSLMSLFLPSGRDIPAPIDSQEFWENAYLAKLYFKTVIGLVDEGKLCEKTYATSLLQGGLSKDGFLTYALCSTRDPEVLKLYFAIAVAAVENEAVTSDLYTSALVGRHSRGNVPLFSVLSAKNADVVTCYFSAINFARAKQWLNQADIDKLFLSRSQNGNRSLAAALCSDYFNLYCDFMLKNMVDEKNIDRKGYVKLIFSSLPTALTSATPDNLRRYFAIAKDILKQKEYVKLLIDQDEKNNTPLRYAIKSPQAKNLQVYLDVVRSAMGEGITAKEYVNLLLGWQANTNFTYLHELFFDNCQASKEHVRIYFNALKDARTSTDGWITPNRYTEFLLRPSHAGFTSLLQVLASGSVENLEAYFDCIEEDLGTEWLPWSVYIDLLLTANHQKFTPLIQALYSKKIKIVTRYFAAIHKARSHGLDQTQLVLLLRASNQVGLTSCCQALSSDNAEIVDCYFNLIDTVLVDQPDDYIYLLIQHDNVGFTPLTCALKSKNIHIVNRYCNTLQAVCEKGWITKEKFKSFVLMANRAGYTSALQALCSGDLAIVDKYFQFIDYAITKDLIDTKDYTTLLLSRTSGNQETPLLHTLRIDNADYFNAYLQRIKRACPAIISKRDYISLLLGKNKNNYSPLQVALQLKDPNNLRYYLRDIEEACGGMDGITPIEYADLLLSLETVDSPLQHVCQHGTFEAIKIYVDLILKALKNGVIQHEQFLSLLGRKYQEKFTFLETATKRRADSSEVVPWLLQQLESALTPVDFAKVVPKYMQEKLDKRLREDSRGVKRNERRVEEALPVVKKIAKRPDGYVLELLGNVQRRIEGARVALLKALFSGDSGKTGDFFEAIQYSLDRNDIESLFLRNDVNGLTSLNHALRIANVKNFELYVAFLRKRFDSFSLSALFRTESQDVSAPIHDAVKVDDSGKLSQFLELAKKVLEVEHYNSLLMNENSQTLTPLFTLLIEFSEVRKREEKTLPDVKNLSVYFVALSNASSIQPHEYTRFLTYQNKANFTLVLQALVSKNVAIIKECFDFIEYAIIRGWLSEAQYAELLWRASFLNYSPFLQALCSHNLEIVDLYCAKLSAMVRRQQPLISRSDERTLLLAADVAPKSGFTPFMQALSSRNIEIVRRYFSIFESAWQRGVVDYEDQGKFLVQVNTARFTPMLSALQSRKIEIVAFYFRMIILSYRNERIQSEQYKAQLLYPNRDGFTILLQAIILNDADIFNNVLSFLEAEYIEGLLSAKEYALLLVQGNEIYRTPLFCLLSTKNDQGQFEINATNFKLYLEKIMAAAVKGILEPAEYFRVLSAIDKNRYTPLYRLFQSGNPENIRFYFYIIRESLRYKLLTVKQYVDLLVRPSDAGNFTPLHDICKLGIPENLTVYFDEISLARHLAHLDTPTYERLLMFRTSPKSGGLTCVQCIGKDNTVFRNKLVSILQNALRYEDYEFLVPREFRCVVAQNVTPARTKRGYDDGSADDSRKPAASEIYQLLVGMCKGQRFEFPTKADSMHDDAFSALGIARERLAEDLRACVANPLFCQQLYGDIRKLFELSRLSTRDFVLLRCILYEAQYDAKKFMTDMSLRYANFKTDAIIGSLKYLEDFVAWLKTQDAEGTQEFLSICQDLCGKLTKAEFDLISYLQSPQCVDLYLQHLASDTLMLGDKSLFAYAVNQKIDLYMWKKSVTVEADSLTLMQHTTTPYSTQVIHVLALDGATRFALLEVSRHQPKLSDHANPEFFPRPRSRPSSPDLPNNVAELKQALKRARDEAYEAQQQAAAARAEAAALAAQTRYAHGLAFFTAQQAQKQVLQSQQKLDYVEGLLRSVYSQGANVEFDRFYNMVKTQITTELQGESVVPDHRYPIGSIKNKHPIMPVASLQQIDASSLLGQEAAARYTVFLLHFTDQQGAPCIRACSDYHQGAECSLFVVIDAQVLNIIQEGLCCIYPSMKGSWTILQNNQIVSAGIDVLPLYPAHIFVQEGDAEGIHYAFKPGIIPSWQAVSNEGEQMAFHP